MKYNVLAKIPTSTVDQQNKIINMVESSGYSYLIDYGSGNTVLMVIETAEPKGMDLETLMSMASIYKKALEANKGNIPAELRDKLKKMDIVDVVNSIQNIFLKVTTAIEKLNIALFCAQNNIPMNGVNNSTAAVVSMTKEDYDIKDSLSRGMEDVINLIISDSEMKTLYGNTINDDNLKTLFEEGRINKLDIAAHAKDIITNKMMSLWAATDVEKGNLKVFCATLCTIPGLQGIIKEFLTREDESHDTISAMAESLSDWVTLTALFQYAGTYMDDLISKALSDRESVIRKMRDYNVIKQLAIKFAKDECGIDVDNCPFSDFVAMLAQGDNYSHLIEFIFSRVREAAKLLCNSEVGTIDEWRYVNIDDTPV